MKDTLIIGAAILVAIAVGAWLMFGGTVPEAGPEASATEGPVAFKVLEAGDNASALEERTNYRIKTQDELNQLWTMIGEGDAPTVDFGANEVLAAFDGLHSTGGYSIRIASVEDIGNARRVIIVHTAPGEACITTDALTSPFTMVTVPKSALPISRVDQEEVQECERD